VDGEGRARFAAAVELGEGSQAWFLPLSAMVYNGNLHSPRAQVLADALYLAAAMTANEDAPAAPDATTPAEVRDLANSMAAVMSVGDATIVVADTCRSTALLLTLALQAFGPARSDAYLAPWLDLLPPVYSHHPQTMGDADLQLLFELPGAYDMYMAERGRLSVPIELVERIVAPFAPDLAVGAVPLHDRLLWASLTVVTRGWGTLHDNTPYCALVPVDYFEHNPAGSSLIAITTGDGEQQSVVGTSHYTTRTVHAGASLLQAFHSAYVHPHSPVV